MPHCWMIRAGSENDLISFFETGFVAIGWSEVGDLSKLKTKQEIRKKYDSVYPDHKKGKAANAVAMLYKFAYVVSTGDFVISYDRTQRQYLYGTVTGAYSYDGALQHGYRHLRPVKWTARIDRPDLELSSRNTLGSVLTLFEVNGDVAEELAGLASDSKKDKIKIDPDKEKEELEELKEDTESRAFELIKDKIAKLSDSLIPELIAAVLRGGGFKTRVSPHGRPDRGVDVMASPDGLGLVEPRIKVEVKHRLNSQMGSQEIRSFIGGFRPGDKGLYVSTGGFSKEARYEADRASYPITLIDLDDLTQLVIDYYERFDPDGKSLIHLVKIYWPRE